MSIPFAAITMGKLQRVANVSLPSEVSKIPFGVGQSLKILYQEKPQVVLCFGSYVSIPVAFAALVLRIPVIIHEQTQEAGLANKIIAPFAFKICISFESSRKYFPKNKTILTGNPIRQSIKNPGRFSLINFKEDLPVIFITGGSQGSHKINEFVFPALRQLTKIANVLHQTGDSKFKDFEKLSREKKKLENSQRYKPIKFLSPDEFGAVLGKAALVIGRAGANTVNELLYLEKPCLLIPLSFAQRDEQARNAGLIKDGGLGEVTNENTSAEVFVKKITFMLRNIDKYKINHKIEWKNSTGLIINILKNASNKH
jgi:UDP-N-acetylglucosamine--N-acetylmuramyl-(pentapeptide) pyrophosphoryl-undecaprenol N-acetylglucosamine transferase